MRPLYYRRDGTPYEGPTATMDWAADFENRTPVGQDEIGDVLVSTVWLGLDHNCSDEGPPLIFETMVFGESLDGEKRRYSTEAEAIAGHAEMVARVRAERKE